MKYKAKQTHKRRRKHNPIANPRRRKHHTKRYVARRRKRNAGGGSNLQGALIGGAIAGIGAIAGSLAAGLIKGTIKNTSPAMTDAQSGNIALAIVGAAAALFLPKTPLAKYTSQVVSGIIAVALFGFARQLFPTLVPKIDGYFHDSPLLGVSENTLNLIGVSESDFSGVSEGRQDLFGSSADLLGANPMSLLGGDTVESVIDGYESEEMSDYMS